MKRFRVAVLVTAVLGLASGFRAEGALTGIAAPNNGETHLYSALGVANNTALNNTQWNAEDDQMFHIGGTVTSILLEAAGYRDRNVFGVYAPGANNTITMVDVFLGSAGPGAQQTITFQNGNIYFNNVSHGAFPLNAQGQVGFYLRPNGSSTTVFYSEQWRNGGGADQMVTFSGKPGSIISPDVDFSPESRFVIAWEDIAYGASDKDFNDMVLQMSVVPEPTTLVAGALLLLPFGVSTLRVLRRKV